MAAKGKLTDNQVAAIIGVVAGLLMLLAGASGAVSIERIVDFLQGKIGTDPAIRLVAYVLVAIASLGGLIVILGSALIASDRVRAGRFMIALGVGFGLISLILFLLVHLEKAEAMLAGGTGVGALGIILSIAARLKSKVKKGG